MTVPNYQKFFLPLLKIAAQGEQSISSAMPFVIDFLKISPEDLQALLPSGKKTKVYDRTNWAKTYLSQSGLIENHKRGFFKITPLGSSLLEENPNEINNDLLRSFKGFRDFEERSRSKVVSAQSNEQQQILERLETSESQTTPSERITSSINEINAALKQEILDNILKNTPKFFELLILKLLLAMGYGVSDESKFHVGGPGDEDVDGIISQDVLGLDKIYVQAKRYQPDNVISGSHISNFCGALSFQNAHKGVFVTTSRFTADAIKLHTRNSNYKIVLIDGDKLADLMIQYNIGVSVESTYHVKRLDSDYFQDGL